MVNFSRYSRLFFGLLILICFSSCSLFKPVQVKKIEAVRVIKNSGKGIELEVSLILQNPNFMKISITQGELALWLNKVDMGAIQLNDKVILPANSEIQQKFTVQLDLSNALLGGISTLMSVLKNNSATLHIKGNVKAKALFISRDFPVDESAQIPFTF
ncbi:MAG TPA: LEA type 2 family protein [Bacteroidia bacterium]|nr:LEA type 2 family protein [Bacteroidia bacterium]HRH09075.1 LEA type 2 family protein [Bacteroidia bacterium]